MNIEDQINLHKNIFSDCLDAAALILQQKLDVALDHKTNQPSSVWGNEQQIKIAIAFPSSRTQEPAL